MAVLAGISACSLREQFPSKGGDTSAVLRIGIGSSARSSLFDSEKESKLACFVLAAYRGGFLATTEYFSSEEGDFESSSEITLPVSVNSGYEYNYYVLANFADLDSCGLFPPYEKDVPGMLLHPDILSGGYLPMAGSGHLEISTGTVSVELKRLVAKINCNVTLPEGAILEEARLCQAPLLTLPFGQDYSAGPDSVTEGDYFSFSASSGHVSGPSGNQGYNLTSEPLYVLENMQGVEDGNTDPWHKYPSDASIAASATYINMKLSFPDGDVEMRFYLGADCFGDYNLERNGCYTMNLSVWDSQATRSGWSMMDLRNTDHWPGGDFLVGQVHRISFVSPEVLLSAVDGAEGVIGLETDGLGNWFITGVGAGEAMIDVIAENTVRWTIPVTVKDWSGTAAALPLGLHGNGVGLFENVMVGSRTLHAVDVPILNMPDDASLLCAEVLRTALYGEEGEELPDFVDNCIVPNGVVATGSAHPDYPERPDSLFVIDPSDWESRYGAGRLYEHAFSLASDYISLDIPVKIGNALYTPCRDSVIMVFDDYYLAMPRRGPREYSITWDWQLDTGIPAPEPSCVSIFSVPITFMQDPNDAVTYGYTTGPASFRVKAILQPSPYVSHAMGRMDVYADVTNRRSGTVCRINLFKEDHYLHFACGARRVYCGRGMTVGEYTYEANMVGVAVELSFDVSNPTNSNWAAEELCNTPGLVSFTGSSFVSLPLANDGYQYYFSSRRQAVSSGYLGDYVYYDYFLGVYNSETGQVGDFYANCDDGSLADSEPLYDIDTEKTSRLFDGWLVLHKYQELNVASRGWVDGNQAFPRNPH